jgi:hypothetical protein
MEPARLRRTAAEGLRLNADRRGARRSQQRPDRRHTGPAPCWAATGDARDVGAGWGDHRRRCAGPTPRAAASHPARGSQRQHHRQVGAGSPPVSVSKALGQGSQVPYAQWPIQVRHGRPKHDRDGVPNRVTRAGCQDKPTARATRQRGGNTQPHRRTAASRDTVTGLQQGRISRSWQPDATTSRWRAWCQTLGVRIFQLVQHECVRPGCTCGTSGPGAQRSRASASITSRLSHPVSSRLAAGLHRALSYYTFYYSARHAKGPLPDRIRVLTCGISSGGGI